MTISLVLIYINSSVRNITERARLYISWIFSTRTAAIRGGTETSLSDDQAFCIRRSLAWQRT